jgi:branched-chain amino acid transport system permease protein
MASTFILQVILGGTLLGGIYGLLSLGMTLNISLLHIMNMAHGSLLILGALSAYGLSIGLGLPPFSAVLLIPFTFGILGRVLYPLVPSSFFKRDPSQVFVSCLLITLGSAFILEEISASVLSHPLIGLYSGFESWHWKGLTFSPLPIVLVLVLGGIILSLVYFLLRTDLGRSLRALAQDAEGAFLVGVPLGLTRAWAWAVSLALTGLAGVFYVLLFPLTPFIGLKITVMSLLMVMGAGSRHLTRSLGAGFFWGILESTGNAVWGHQWGALIPIAVFLLLASLFPAGLKFSR